MALSIAPLLRRQMIGPSCASCTCRRLGCCCPSTCDCCDVDKILSKISPWTCSKPWDSRVLCQLRVMGHSIRDRSGLFTNRIAEGLQPPHQPRLLAHLLEAVALQAITGAAGLQLGEG